MNNEYDYLRYPRDAYDLLGRKYLSDGSVWDQASPIMKWFIMVFGVVFFGGAILAPLFW